MTSILQQAAQAKANGLKTFIADKGCRPANHFERDLWGQCVQCTRNKRLRRQITPEKREHNRQYQKQYRKDNPDICSKRVMDWHKRNPDKVEIIRKRWLEKHDRCRSKN